MYVAEQIRNIKEVRRLKISKSKLDVALARKCKTLSDFRSEGFSPQTLRKLRRGENTKPITVGRLAAALGVDPLEIVETEE